MDRTLIGFLLTFALVGVVVVSCFIIGGITPETIARALEPS